MKLTRATSTSERKRAKGAAAVEFAVTVGIFLALVLGVVQFSLFMYVLIAQTEATRLGTRLAIVCGTSDKAFLRDRMHDLLPALPASASYVSIAPPAAGCTATTCEPVTVNVELDLPIPNFLPLPDLKLLGLGVPRIRTTALTAEGMNPTGNPVCN